MNRTYYKLNIDDVIEIVSDYLAENSGYKTFATNTRVFEDEGNWNMVIAIGEADDFEIHKIDMEELNKNIKYNGIHGQKGCWQSDDEIKETIKVFLANNKNTRIINSIIYRIKHLFDK